MIISDKLLQDIKRRAQSIDYGEIIIKLNNTSNGIDVIYAPRIRYEKEKKVIENIKEKGVERKG